MPFNPSAYGGVNGLLEFVTKLSSSLITGPSLSGGLLQTYVYVFQL